MMAALIARFAPYRLMLAAIIAFGAGWQVQGWRLQAEISTADMHLANENMQRAGVAFSDLVEASRRIHEAADGAHTDVSTITAKLDAIDRRYRNAKPTPLPADCKPDDVRVQRLTDAAAAANEAITRPVPSR